MDRQALRSQFENARRETDRLFSVVREDSLYDRPIDRRHRLIFYLGHLEAFDWNHIARFGLAESAFEPALDQLFAAGIDPDSSSLPQDRPSDWPSLNHVRGYVNEVRKRIDGVLGQAPEDLVRMALEHRLMHAETLAYGLHAMPYEAKSAEAENDPEPAPPPANPMCEIPAGSATMGRNRSEGFGWDNEFDRHRVTVGRFAIQRFKVTNGDYLEFVKQGAEHPAFWVLQKNEWFYRGMFRLKPLALDEPVYVTWSQASAYAKWKGLCLPTEAQFHRAAFGSPHGAEFQYPWGDDLPTPRRGNFNFASWDPVSVTRHCEGESAFGVSQLVGNGWEWTRTPFAPFDGFTPAPNYPGYSQNFFDGEHYVLKGGSPRTASCLLRRSFRNWFRPDYPHVYATFRCVEC